jgi:CheY-like chemotaxis protein
VFEEFYQLGNPERDRTQGLGLGLSIVKRLAELLQLNLVMQSALGSGSRFTLQLHAAVRPSDSVATLPLPTSINGVHILVVDDEEGVRLGMQTLLEGLGCRVSLATGTDAAAQGAVTERPDIVLADFRLRGDDDGVATIARLRDLHPRLPALLVSGDTAPARLREAHAAGLRLLHKPVAVDVLSRAIREEVDRGRNTRHGAGP